MNEPVSEYKPSKNSGPTGVPAIRFTDLERPRISQWVDECLEEGAQLIVVEAPSGYGKTAALAHWSLQSGRGKWLSACHAASFSQMMGGLFGLNSAEPDSALRDWVEHLDAPTVVVIDNYESLTSFETDEQLVKLFPLSSYLKVVVLTRRSTVLATPLTTARVRAAYLGPTELAFTDEESLALAQKRNIDSLPQRWDRTATMGGWPLAIQAALSSVVAGDDEGQCSAKLADGLYQRAGTIPRARILTAAALFSGLRMKSLSDVMGVPEAEIRDQCRTLREAGCLLPEASDSTAVGVPPGVVIPYLCDNARRVWDSEELGLLAESLARWLEPDDPTLAFTTLIRERRLGAAADILNRRFMRILDDRATTMEALRKVPSTELDAFPEILMARLILERVDDSLPIGPVEDLAARLHESVRRAMVQASDRRMLLLQTYLIATERMIGNWPEALRLSHDLMRRVEEYAPRYTGVDSARRFATMCSVVALTGCLGGDFALAKIAAERGLESARLSGDKIEEVHALGLLALADALTGHFVESSENLAHMDEVAKKHEVTLREFSWADGEIARVLTSASVGADDVSQEALSRLAPQVERMEQWPLVVLAEADHMAFIHGQVEALQLLESRIKHKPQHRILSDYWRSRVLEWEVNACMSVGRIARAEQVMQEMDTLKSPALSTHVRFVLLKTDYVGVVLEVEKALRGDLRNSERRQLLLFGAIAAGKVADKDLAAQWWLELADEGGTLPPLLFSMVPFVWITEGLAEVQKSKSNLTPKTRCLIDQLESTPDVFRMHYFAPLSRAEQGVLEALVAGDSIPVTAERLFLSENTVKFHLRSLYRKLHVTSREDAVRRGLETGALKPGRL